MRLILYFIIGVLAIWHAAPGHADGWNDARREFRAAQKNEDWKERRLAYLTLLDWDSKRAFEEVLSATLKEKSAPVVLEGIKTLGTFESEEARAAFDAAVAKPKGRKGQYLLLAFAHQKGAHGVEKLAQIVVGKDAQMATLAAYALGRKAVEGGVDPLVAALGHKDWHVVAEAARSLKRIAWSSMTKPDKKSGKLPEPAMPEWFDPKPVVAALAAGLPKAVGPARGARIEALESITKKDYGDNPDAWKLVAEGEEPSAAVLMKRKHPPYFFKIPVYGKRIAIVMDINVLCDNAHPFTDRALLQKLCAVPGGRDLAWFKIKSVWQFNAAHVKRFIQDLPTRGVKFDLVFSGMKPRPLFGKLTGANSGNKNTAVEDMDKVTFKTQNDVLGAMTTALDISGKKDSVAWTKGPDVVCAIYSSVPWQAPETDGDVIGAAIGLKARLRGIQVHAVGVHEFAYEMLKTWAETSGGRYLELNVK